jgi:hypothetical protein
MHTEQASKPHGEYHGGTVVRGASVRVSGDPARVGVPGHPHPPGASEGGEPRIEIIRNGDVIEAIDIVCGCGQHIRLHCLYAGATVNEKGK